jgi:hypothetical protein
LSAASLRGVPLMTAAARISCSGHDAGASPKRSATVSAARRILLSWWKRVSIMPIDSWLPLVLYRQAVRPDASIADLTSAAANPGPLSNLTTRGSPPGFCCTNVWYAESTALAVSASIGTSAVKPS